MKHLAHHQQPILAGLGDHIPNHRPAGWEQWARDNPLLVALSELAKAQFQGAIVEPSDVEDLLDSGFRYVVVDPATQHPALAKQWAETHNVFFRSLWGEPMREVGSGAVWEVLSISEPTQVYASFQSRPRRNRKPSTRTRTPEPPSPPPSEP